MTIENSETAQAAARTILERDPLAYADFLEPLNRGTGIVRCVTTDSVLLQEAVSGAYLMTAKDTQTAATFVATMENATLVAAHETYDSDAITAKFGIPEKMTCVQAVYTKPHAIEMPTGDICIRALSEAYAETVDKLYTIPLGLGYITSRLAAGELFGAFLGDTLVGFIGTHDEGSMGLLEVLPDHKGRGVGAALLAFITNRQRSLQRMAFSQMTLTNAASRRLHEKLGFTIVEHPVTWFY